MPRDERRDPRCSSNAVAIGWAVDRVRHGFASLITGEFLSLGAREVGGIIQPGGTILGSARSVFFMKEEGQLEALRQLSARRIDSLGVIGGKGSQAGADALSQRGFPVVGIPPRIDNDRYGSGISIGVDTALNIALEAIDRIKVTASSHQREFLMEVMGRDCGYPALHPGIAGGAGALVIPEVQTDPVGIAETL